MIEDSAFMPIIGKILGENPLCINTSLRPALIGTPMNILLNMN